MTSVKVHLKTPAGQRYTAAFPGGPQRALHGDWTREFQKCGPLGVRLYTHPTRPPVVWIANAHPNVNVVDFASLHVEWAGGRVNVEGSIECFPTRRGKVFRLGQDDSYSIPDPAPLFGPLDLKQPSVDRVFYEDIARLNLASIRESKKTGSNWFPSMPGLDGECGLMTPKMGMWRVLGPIDGAAPGGSDIRFLPGYDQSVSGALLERERMDAAIDRTLCAWDDAGEYRTVESYGDPGPQYTASRSPYVNDGELPGYMLPFVGQSACAYRTHLEEIPAYDFAHSSRILNPAQVSYEYLTDPVAQDLLVDLAEEARLAFSDKGNYGGGGWVPSTLRNFRDGAKQNPHQGGNGGRMRGWPAWNVAMADKIRPRDAYRDWSSMFMEWASLMVMPNKLWQRVSSPPLWGPAGTDACQAFEQAIFCFALAGIAYRRGDQYGTHASILEAAKVMYLNRRVPLQPDPWHQPPNTSYGPHHFLYVGATGGAPFAQVTGGKGSTEGSYGTGDPAHCESLAGLCHLISGEEKWLSALKVLGWPAPTLAQKIAAMQAAHDKSWTAISEQQAVEAHPAVPL